MTPLFKRVPLIFWAIILCTSSYFVVKANYIENLSSDQTRLLSGFLTFIGLIFVAINLQKQWKNERIKTEYLNQPDFIVKGFSSDKFYGSGPRLCKESNQCTDDHWFDLEQTGNLAAKELKFALFTKIEANQDVRLKNRWLEEEQLVKGDSCQYKLPPFKIPISFFDQHNSMCFLLLLEYKSQYSNIKYKRVYRLCASAIKNPETITENDWKGRIKFFDNTLIKATDSESLSVKEIIQSKWQLLALWLKIKKYYTYEEWAINI